PPNVNPRQPRPVVPTEGSTQAFYIANENKPENLAGSTSRLFIGVKLECAQCHDHPFARWTRKQFWEYAVFFSDVQPVRRDPKGKPVAPAANVREIRIPDTDKIVRGRFLNGVDPVWRDGVSGRVILTEWLTSADNPFFARATVDHLWSYFTGLSLMEPI